MKKEESPNEKLEKEISLLEKTLEYEFYNLRLKTLAEKIKSETSCLKSKTINY